MKREKGGRMQFSKARKNEMDSSNPSYQSMNCVRKWGN